MQKKPFELAFSLCLCGEKNYDALNIIWIELLLERNRGTGESRLSEGARCILSIYAANSFRRPCD